MKKNSYSFIAILLAFLALSCLNSCVSSKKLAYFTNLQKDSTATIDEQRLQTKINVSDILQINISTPDPITTAILNSSTAINTGQGGVSGYLVDENRFY
jgi:polysaccharide export outer membrane protein